MKLLEDRLYWDQVYDANYGYHRTTPISSIKTEGLLIPIELRVMSQTMSQVRAAIRNRLYKLDEAY